MSTNTVDKERKVTTSRLIEMKRRGEKIAMLTAYDYSMAQLIDQATAEWEERLTQQRLTLVTTLPEGETWVFADGRHLWRVLDNLLSNCAKYAMEGTRVYLELLKWDGNVIFSLKNVSASQLNIPAEQLMERFVRGDESRTTEGSGLGLSIARSLTELQGGAFRLEVDGDLFKAVVSFPESK